MGQHHNARNPAVKRLIAELREIARDDDPDIVAEALEVRRPPLTSASSPAPLTAPRAPLAGAGKHIRVALCDSGGMGHGV